MKTKIVVLCAFGINGAIAQELSVQELPRNEANYVIGAKKAEKYDASKHGEVSEDGFVAEFRAGKNKESSPEPGPEPGPEPKKPTKSAASKRTTK